MPKKLQVYSFICSLVVLILGLLDLAWNIIYKSHSWNEPLFYTGYGREVLIVALGIAIVCVIVFYFLFRLLYKKSKNKIGILSSYVAFTIYNAAVLTIIISMVYDSFIFSRDFSNLKLDIQLSSENIPKFHEAVDSVIARSDNHDLYCQSHVSDFMMKAARNGYAPAQNYVGVYFHEKAKEKNDRLIGYDKWNNTNCYYCQEELNRATYWWLKAANQNHGRAQENLGRMKMNNLLSNQPYSFGDARYWLTEATKNGIISAYYYLGLLSRDRSLSDAANYWKIGAEKGNEDCKRMLENPDFIDVTLTPSN